MASFDSAKSLKNQINLFLDNELPQEDQQSLISKMANDPRCQNMYNREKDFRDFVKSNVKRPSVSPDFIQSLKNRIQM